MTKHLPLLVIAALCVTAWYAVVEVRLAHAAPGDIYPNFPNDLQKLVGWRFPGTFFERKSFGDGGTMGLGGVFFVVGRVVEKSLGKSR